MENFGAFYEHTIFLAWVGLGGIAVLLVLYRLVRLFFHYINTGEIGKFYESCYSYHLMEGDGLDPQYARYLFRGIHPGAIFFDIISYAGISLFAGMLWLPLSIILPFIGVAYLLRQRIAKKQNFIAKLDGTYAEENK